MPKSSSAPVEQAQHRKAFALYHAQGEQRSHQKVAAEMGVSVGSVKNWSRIFRWKERIYEHDAETARQIADKLMSDGTAETERNLKIVRAALMRLAKGIADGNVKLQIGDLDRLVRLEEHLVESLRPVVGSVPGHGVVLILPDNGRDPLLRPPVFVMPDNHSSIEYNRPKEPDSDVSTTED